MKVMVTGGDGFIGRYVQSRLTELGIEPVVFDITHNITHDVTNYDSLLEFVRDNEPDGIIHLAGMLGTHELWDTTDDAIDVNIKGALNVARIAMLLDVKLVSIEQPHIWYNVYEATKFAARRMLTGLSLDSGLRVEFVTAHNAFGPGQHHGDGHPQKIVPTFATYAWLGEPIPIWGDGNQMVNLVYAGDVAHTLVERVLTVDSCQPERQFNAGSTELWSVNHVADRALYIAGSEAGVAKDLTGRRGEQNSYPYPEPDASYPHRLSIAMLDHTIRSYRPEGM